MDIFEQLVQVQKQTIATVKIDKIYTDYAKGLITLEEKNKLIEEVEEHGEK